jgi:hypothetical protein
MVSAKESNTRQNILGRYMVHVKDCISGSGQTEDCDPVLLHESSFNRTSDTNNNMATSNLSKLKTNLIYNRIESQPLIGAPSESECPPASEWPWIDWLLRRPFSRDDWASAERKLTSFRKSDPVYFYEQILLITIIATTKHVTLIM